MATKAKTTKKKVEAPEVKAVIAECPYEVPALDLKYTMEGKEVNWLQWQLVKFGYDLPETGIFETKTLEAVKDFQEKHGLEANGVVDTLTKAELRR